MKPNTDDCIIVERKVFLDLIAAAEGARAWMAHNCPARQWENGVRQRLNEALNSAVSHHIEGEITLAFKCNDPGCAISYPHTHKTGKSANDGCNHLRKK